MWSGINFFILQSYSSYFILLLGPLHTGHSISTSPCLLEILSSSANSPMIQLGTLAIWPQAVCFILISVSSAIIDAFFTVESVIRGTYVYSHFIRLPHEHKRVFFWNDSIMCVRYFRWSSLFFKSFFLSDFWYAFSFLCHKVHILFQATFYSCLNRNHSIWSF